MSTGVFCVLFAIEAELDGLMAAIAGVTGVAFPETVKLKFFAHNGVPPSKIVGFLNRDNHTGLFTVKASALGVYDLGVVVVGYLVQGVFHGLDDV